MKTLLIALFTCLSILFSTIAAKAANAVYLPFVASPAAVQIVAATGTPDFTVESIRVWDASENGGSTGQCGNQHKLEIHVFNATGNQGDLSRLNDVAVRIVRFDEHGARRDEIFYTGHSEPGKGKEDKGKVEIELWRSAEISISADVDGRSVTSGVVRVTNLAYAIPTDRLIESGYCTDAASCQAFISANACNGNFSWTVVFKRGF